jgi:hypothetical protein
MIAAAQMQIRSDAVSAQRNVFLSIEHSTAEAMQATTASHQLLRTTFSSSSSITDCTLLAAR